MTEYDDPFLALSSVKGDGHDIFVSYESSEKGYRWFISTYYPFVNVYQDTENNNGIITVQEYRGSSYNDV